MVAIDRTAASGVFIATNRSVSASQHTLPDRCILFVSRGHDSAEDCNRKTERPTGQLYFEKLKQTLGQALQAATCSMPRSPYVYREIAG
jgi:hypothetical protein